MNNSSFSRVVAIAMVVLVLFTGTRSFAQTESLSADPLGLTRLLQKFARDFVDPETNPIDEARLRELVTYTAVSALVDGTIDDVYQSNANVAETARTDRQVGGGSSSAASTRLTEKAGVNATLGLAIENGAIQQASRVTELTLSTSPYAFIAWAKGDTQENVDRYDGWRRFGFSFTFNVSEAQAATFGTLDTEDFSEFGFRMRILGDRSTRTAAFLEVWKEKVLPDIIDLLNKQKRATDVVLDTKDDEERKLDALAQATDGNVVYRRLQREYGAYRIQNPTATEAQKRQNLYNILLEILMDEVYEPVKSGKLLADEKKRQAIIEKIYPGLGAVLAEETNKRSRIKEVIKAHNQGQSLLTFDYALHPIEGGSDYSELKVVYQNFVDPFDIALNGFVNLNHNPSADVDPNQQTVREYGGTLSLNVNVDNVFPGVFGDPNMRPITLTASGEVSRLQDVRDMMYAAQVRIDLPVFSGFTIPITLNYGSRTETTSSNEFTVTLGGGIELDTILAVVRARNFEKKVTGN